MTVMIFMCFDGRIGRSDAAPSLRNLVITPFRPMERERESCCRGLAFPVGYTSLHPYRVEAYEYEVG